MSLALMAEAQVATPDWQKDRRPILASVAQMNWT